MSQPDPTLAATGCEALSGVGSLLQCPPAWLSGSLTLLFFALAIAVTLYLVSGRADEEQIVGLATNAWAMVVCGGAAMLATRLFSHSVQTALGAGLVGCIVWLATRDRVAHETQRAYQNA